MLDLAPETEKLLSELAARTGREPAAVVHDLVAAEAARTAVAKISEKTPAERKATLLEIANRISALPLLDDRTADEILDYDENGLPR
jgi:antitoxin VapB